MIRPPTDAERRRRRRGGVATGVLVVVTVAVVAHRGAGSARRCTPRPPGSRPRRWPRSAARGARWASSSARSTRRSPRAATPRRPRPAWRMRCRPSTTASCCSTTTGEIVFRNRRGRGVPRRPPRRGARRVGHRGAGRAPPSAARRARATLELFGPPRRTLVLSADPLDDGYRSIGALVVIEDVTERQRLEAVRRDFVANISHELKTPVGGIGVLAETLVERGRPRGHRAGSPSGCTTRRCGSAAPSTTCSSSAASRPARRRSREPVPVHLVLAEAVERASTAAEQRGITLELDGAVPPARRASATGASSSRPSPTCSTTP